MTRRKRLMVIGLIVTAVTLLAAVAYAAGTARVTNGINNVRIKTETSFFGTTGTAWATVTGAEFKMAVPSGQQKTFIAQFGAESICTGDSGDWCSVRILMDGVEMDPASGSNFAFDSVGGDFWEGNYMTRVAGPVPAGKYTFTVQARGRNANTSIGLDDWTFMVMKAAS